MPERFTKHECLHAIQLLKFHSARQLFELEQRYNGNFYGAWKRVAKKFPGAENPREPFAKLGDIRIVTARDPEYPDVLNQSHDKPYMLYVRGKLGGSQVCAAFIGSRKMSTYGSQATERVIAGLASLNLCIVSGLAYGVDACSHRAALKYGLRTIAVLGSGIDSASIYPPEHRELAEQIVAAGGALVSEFPPGSPVLKFNFPLRNRIIAALCRAVCVIQASVKSGSLITAREALSEGRDVFAVPGSIFQETSDGTNALIASGAHVLRSAADLAAHYPELHAPEGGVRLPNRALPHDTIQKKVLAAVTIEGSPVEKISAATNLPVSTVSASLTMLEIAGYTTSNGTGIYSLKLQLI